MNASAALERLRDWERLPLATLPTPPNLDLNSYLSD